MVAGRIRGGAVRLLRALVLGLVVVGSTQAIAQTNGEADDLEAVAEIDREVARALKSNSATERSQLLRAALTQYDQSFRDAPNWRSAAGAMKVYRLLERPDLASAWYWLATDHADYSDEYVAWQRTSVAIFEEYSAVTFDFVEVPASVVLDGETLPTSAALLRPIALAVGEHQVAATSVEGNTALEELTIDAEKRQLRVRVPFTRTLKAGEVDPRDPVVGKGAPARATTNFTDPLTILTVVGTVTLASGIAIGGGYLLLGDDNPKSFDSAGGVALIITELILIGGGTTLALLMD